MEKIDYDVDPQRAKSFSAAIRTYWPDLPEGALQPAYAGIRPKIARPGGSSTDFLIQTEREHGVRGLVNLFGIVPRPDSEPRDRRGDRGSALSARLTVGVPSPAGLDSAVSRRPKDSRIVEQHRHARRVADQFKLHAPKGKYTQVRQVRPFDGSDTIVVGSPWTVIPRSFR